MPNRYGFFRYINRNRFATEMLLVQFSFRFVSEFILFWMLDRNPVAV